MEILTGILMAVHRQSKPNVHTPHLSASIGIVSSKYGGSQTSQTGPARLPSGAITKASPASQRLRFPVRDFAKCESIDGNVIKNDEAMIDSRTFRAGNQCWLSRARAFRLVLNGQSSSLPNLLHHSLPSACHFLTSSSTENPW